MLLIKKPLLFILFCFIFYSCASVKLRTADTYYEQLQYEKAIPYYEQLLDRNYSYDVLIKLADSYRNIKNYKKSEELYSRIITLQSDPIYQKYYAEALMQNGKYAEAKKWFGKYLSLNRNDEKAQNLMASCDSIQILFRDSLLFTIDGLKFNAPSETNFAPSFYRSGIVYVSNRNPDIKYLKLKPTVDDYDLFYAKRTENGNWLEPEVIRGNVNTIFNEGPCVFNKSFTKVYITRNNSEGKRIVTNEKDENVLKIYYGSTEDGEWKIDGEMAFNSNEYSVGHPALSLEGNVMILASDMPWGYGGTDLYRTENVGGTWTKPVNLGKDINTSGNEMFPFLLNDSVLYYSSEGNIGLGGLDVFRSQLIDNNWTAVENLGYPINSSKDDFGLICEADENTGYFSSNRKNDKDQIFSFHKNPPIITLKGMISEKANGKPIKNASLQLRSAEGNKVLSTDANGNFYATLANNNDYTVIANEKNFFLTSAQFTTKGLRKATELEIPIALEKVTFNKPIIWRGIAFDKGSSILKKETKLELDKLCSILKDNPDIKIELSCHTDARGSDKENLILSQARADAATEYAFSKGIERDRIAAVGYGSIKLLNNCVKGVLCLEEDHMLNVRTEIKYLNYTK